MANVDKGKIGGFSIRKLIVVMAAITLIISASLIWSSYRTYSLSEKMRLSTTEYVEAGSAAQDMQSASDYLTEQVLFFVWYGEKIYLDNYFEESEVTRRREKALEKIQRKFSGTEEFAALEKAYEQSRSLMNREYYAMRLKAESLGYDLSVLPSAISAVVLNGEDEELSLEKKGDRAMEVVFSEEYRAEKSVISFNTKICLTKLVGKLQSEQQTALGKFTLMVVIQQILIVVLIIMVLAAGVLFATQIVSPLLMSIPNIEKDGKIQAKGAKEFRILASTYNRIYDDNRESKEKLAYEALHDGLTGVFNRKGFEIELKKQNIYPYALLLIDVDNFKGINDEYGHEVGDKILIKVTETVKTRFRADDALCRMGGDEFALIMPRVGKELKNAVAMKIEEINAKLGVASADCPAASVSVGIAFAGEDSVADIYKCADTALYRVKKRGRRGYAFYEE